VKCSGARICRSVQYRAARACDMGPPKMEFRYVWRGRRLGGYRLRVPADPARAHAETDRANAAIESKHAIRKLKLPMSTLRLDFLLSIIRPYRDRDRGSEVTVRSRRQSTTRLPAHGTKSGHEWDRACSGTARRSRTHGRRNAGTLSSASLPKS
jgi:hypothetical protein